MDELYDDLAGELDSLHVQWFLEAREWRSTDFIYTACAWISWGQRMDVHWFHLYIYSRLLFFVLCVSQLVVSYVNTQRSP
jgi:hypothetical protein